MTDEVLESIKNRLQDVLKKDRFDHVMGVAYTSAALAMKYDVDMKKAFTAGLLHDCAKAYPTYKYIEMCMDYGLPVSVYEEKNPQLLHAKLGGFLAKDIYGIFDEEIIQSIIYHTTGKANMTMLEKIVFVADYIEPGRDKAKRLTEIRKEAFENIDNSIVMILEDTIKYLENKSDVIDPNANLAYDYYKGAN